VSVPINKNVRWIYHTHPATSNPSFEDFDILNKLRAAGSDQESSIIVPLKGKPVQFKFDGTWAPID
jgi:hypothetical protein